jgi:ElaB/YqjD/DUF883 family membrane-anchored ribosome-binding protein
MIVRLMVSLASLAVLVAVAAPLPASARMHFTTTRERLEALAQRAQSSLALTNPTEVQTQVREMITQAQAAKAAADEAAGRPASGAEDRTVLTTVGQEMDGVVASANRALTATGADQNTALQDVKTRADRSLTAVNNRITAQLAQPAPSPSPGTLPASGGVPAQVGAAPALWLAGLAVLTLGLGVWTRSRRRGEP